MYLCFEVEEKRMAFPEESVVNFDENGFTVKSMIGSRPGKNLAFINMTAYQGCTVNFNQALAWVKRAPRSKQNEGQRPQAPRATNASLPENPNF